MNKQSNPDNYLAVGLRTTAAGTDPNISAIVEISLCEVFTNAHGELECITPEIYRYSRDVIEFSKDREERFSGDISNNWMDAYKKLEEMDLEDSFTGIPKLFDKYRDDINKGETGLLVYSRILEEQDPKTECEDLSLINNLLSSVSHSAIISPPYIYNINQAFKNDPDELKTFKDLLEKNDIKIPAGGMASRDWNGAHLLAQSVVAEPSLLEL